LSPIPSAEINVKLGNVQTMEEIPGCIELDHFDELWVHFSSPPHKHLHVIMQIPDDGEYPYHLFMFSILLIDAPFFLCYCSYFADVSCWLIPPSPLYCFLHCLYFAMFSALLIVNHWFAIISCRHNSDLLSMDHKYPFFCLRASWLSSQHHLCFYNSILSILISSAFHVDGFHCILSICLIYLPPLTNNPVTPEHRAKRPRLEGSEMPRTPPNATQVAQTQGMSSISPLNCSEHILH